VLVWWVSCVPLKSGDVSPPDLSDAAGDATTPIDVSDTGPRDGAAAGGDVGAEAMVDGRVNGADATDATADVHETDAPSDGDAAGSASDGETGDSRSDTAGTLGEAPDDAPMGYRRLDVPTSVVVYRSAVNHVVQVESSGVSWNPPEDLSLLGRATTTALGQVFGFARSDGTSNVVYLGADGDVHLIERGDAGWLDSDLTQTADAAPGDAVGSPMAFVRSDGATAVVYRTADDHIHELSLAAAGWTDVDLTNDVSAPSAASDPAGFARGDGVDSVVYQAFDLAIDEISSPVDAGYAFDGLARATGCGFALGKPHPYLRSDGVPSVIFRSAANVPAVLEIARVSAMWSCFNVTAVSDNPLVVPTGGEPAPYVRADLSLAVLFRTADDHLVELSYAALANPLPSSWHVTDLTTASGASPAASDPAGYVRSDGMSAVVFRSRGDNHVRELRSTPAGWVASDLNGP
jgi:hypothetical protein